MRFKSLLVLSIYFIIGQAFCLTPGRFESLSVGSATDSTDRININAAADLWGKDSAIPWSMVSVPQSWKPDTANVALKVYSELYENIGVTYVITTESVTVIDGDYADIQLAHAIDTEHGMNGIQFLGFLQTPGGNGWVTSNISKNEWYGDMPGPDMGYTNAGIIWETGYITDLYWYDEAFTDPCSWSNVSCIYMYESSLGNQTCWNTISAQSSKIIITDSLVIDSTFSCQTITSKNADSLAVLKNTSGRGMALKSYSYGNYLDLITGSSNELYIRGANGADGVLLSLNYNTTKIPNGKNLVIDTTAKLTHSSETSFIKYIPASNAQQYSGSISKASDFGFWFSSSVTKSTALCIIDIPSRLYNSTFSITSVLSKVRRSSDISTTFYRVCQRNEGSVQTDLQIINTQTVATCISNFGTTPTFELICQNKILLSSDKTYFIWIETDRDATAVYYYGFEIFGKYD